MLTVLLGTRNRGRILRDVLEGFCRLMEPSGGWKVIVVDNGSTDDTPQVLAEFQGRLPLQPLSVPQPGKNKALNAALPLVAGDLVVFTDDDVFPRTDWLIRLREAADTQPEYSIFGGVVISRWQVEPPRWALWSELGAAYTVSSPLAKEGPVAPELWSGTIVGANMAIRARIFESGARFDPAVGPNGGSYAMGSETEILLRLAWQGHKAYHLQGAVIEHLIRKEQLDQAWVLQRAVRFGRGLLRQSPDVKLWFGMPRHLFRDIPKQAVVVAATWLSMREEALFQARWFFNIYWGKAIEAIKIAKERHERSHTGPAIPLSSADR